MTESGSGSGLAPSEDRATPAAADRSTILRQLPLWASLSDDLTRTIAEAMETVTYRAGETIIRQGEPGRHFSILLSGKADVRVRADGGTVITVATLGGGESFGEMSLLGEDLTSADVVAVEDCETLALGRDAFHELMSTNPVLLREFVRLLSRRLKASDVAIGEARQSEEELTRFLQEQKSEQYSVLIGAAKPIKDLQKQIDARSALHTPLLVFGERGTGKELIARLVHLRGPRKDAPLVSVECGQITESQWGDQLFGPYTEGAAPNVRGRSYAGLARGGTLLLKNVQAMPPAVQERLVRFLTREALPAGAAPDVRVVATSRVNLLEEAATGRFSADLAAILLGDVLEAPSLRSRKRDIPELAGHFVKKHAQRLGKPITALDDQAMIRLVSYDYLFANVQELEESIERAVIISDGESIAPEAIFLGLPPSQKPRGFNLLELPAPLVRTALRFFPGGVRVIAGVFFLFILYLCFFVPAGSKGNLGTILVWAVWWPALVFSFFFAGRAWCSICPMAAAGEVTQRLVHRWHQVERRIPAWLKDHDVAIVMAGFFLIVLVEEATGMRHSPLATGILLLTIITGALVTSALFPRRTWCRHLCPMGGFAGLCSTSALLELRPTPDICSAKCKGHSCYKGDATIPGCPMFQHVMFVDSNRDCVMCLNCVKLCPNGSPQLNLRVPARELWTSVSARPQVGLLVVLLLGLLLGQSAIQLWESQATSWARPLLEQHRMAFVSAWLGLCAALPLAFVWLATRRDATEPDPVSFTRQWQRVISWAPLLVAGYASHQIANIPEFDRLRFTIGGLAIPGIPEPLLALGILPTMQVALLAMGLAFTVAAYWKIGPDAEAEGTGGLLRRHALGLSGPVIYGWALLLVLVLRPAWLTI